MQVGDLVRWIGFPGSTLAKRTGPTSIGMVIRVVCLPGNERVDVMWGDGSKGNLLYPGTLEVIHEMVTKNVRI